MASYTFRTTVYNVNLDAELLLKFHMFHFRHNTARRNLKVILKRCYTLVCENVNLHKRGILSYQSGVHTKV